jgi:hypothetical protein
MPKQNSTLFKGRQQNPNTQQYSIEYLAFSQKLRRHEKNQESVIQNQRKKQSVETDPELGL